MVADEQCVAPAACGGVGSGLVELGPDANAGGGGAQEAQLVRGGKA